MKTNTEPTALEKLKERIYCYGVYSDIDSNTGKNEDWENELIDLINEALSEAEIKAAIAFTIFVPTHLRGDEINEYKIRQIERWQEKNGAKI